MGRFHRHDDNDHGHDHGHGHGHDHGHDHDNGVVPGGRFGDVIGDHSGYETGTERVTVLERIFGENERTAVVTADLRDPKAVMSDPEVTRLIDFGQPTAIMLVGILHHLHDDEDPQGIVEAYMNAVPSGSYLFVTHFCASSQAARDAEKQYLAILGTGRFRTVEEITAYFDGLDLLEPGVVPLPLWRPDGPVPPEDELTVGQWLMYGGIARKP